MLQLMDKKIFSSYADIFSSSGPTSHLHFYISIASESNPILCGIFAKRAILFSA